jgi:cytochrome P450
MSSKYQELLDAVNVYWLAKLFMGDILVRNFPWPWTRRKQNVLKEVHNKVIQAIALRQNMPPEEKPQVKEHANLIDVLLNAPEPVSHQMILDECLTFLFGGLDTTSRLIAWMTYFLGTYPTIQQKLYDEVQQVIGDRDITAEDIPKLQYCKQIMQETLRLRPSIPGFDRWAAEDCMLGGYFIPKHTVLALYFINAHLDPKHWDKPHEFIPERWDTQNENPDRHHFAFLPFSAGERGCIGQKFGLQEAAVVICIVIQQYKFAIQEKPKIRMVTDPLLSPYDVEVIFTKRT